MGMGDERPEIPVDEDTTEIAEKCQDDRESLTPKQTADCAGMELVREYENEEDGGS